MPLKRTATDGAPEGHRWRIDFTHCCGHTETHRLRIGDGGLLRLPTPGERKAYRRKLAQQPCSACLTGTPVGTRIDLLGLLEVED